MDFNEMTLRGFAEILSSKEAVPGGGAASAVAGALGACLAAMVGNLTIGKPKYAEVQDDMERLTKKAESLRDRLFALADKDASAFAPLAEAYGLPKETDQEREYKTRKMEEALLLATSAPMEIMKACCEAIDALSEVANKGARIAISDVGVGALFVGAALKGAYLNIIINTDGMKDRETADRLNEKALDLMSRYAPEAERIYEKVAGTLKG